jgi:hypothetical protein
MKVGYDFAAVTPKGYEPNANVITGCKKIAFQMTAQSKTGGTGWAIISLIFCIMVRMLRC